MRAEAYQPPSGGARRLAGRHRLLIRLGERFVCEIDNVSPGSRLARAEGATREEAEDAAIAAAERRLARTRVHDVD